MNKKDLNPHVSVDCVVFGFDGNSLQVLLIERQQPDGTCIPALPGDLIVDDEDLDQAAIRVLKELTGLQDIFLQQFKAYGDPDRTHRPEDLDWMEVIRENPKARVLTIAYYSLIPLINLRATASSFARDTSWVDINQVPDLAFDHNLIVDEALKSLRKKLQFEPIAKELLPAKFTLRDLQKVYEIILGVTLDKRNFRKRIVNSNIVKLTNSKESGVRHKPAMYYSFNTEEIDAGNSNWFQL